MGRWPHFYVRKRNLQFKEEGESPGSHGKKVSVDLPEYKTYRKIF